MSANTIYFPSPIQPPSLIHRSNSDSSIESTSSSLSVRTPTDNIFHRTDEDFGGEPGLAMEDVLEGIKTLLLDGELPKFQFQPTSTLSAASGTLVTWKITPLLDRDSSCLQVRMTEDEVKSLVTALNHSHDLKVTASKSLLSRHLPGAVRYTIIPSIAYPLDAQFKQYPTSPREGSSRITLHEFSKPAPRFVRSEDSDDEEEQVVYKGRLEEDLVCHGPSSINKKSL